MKAPVLLHVLLSIPFIARRDDYSCAKLAARSHVGQVVNLRRIGNPPAGSTRNRCLVGQPILAAAAFQAALRINLRTSTPSRHNPLSALQRATPPPLGHHRQPSLRYLPPSWQSAHKPNLPTRSPYQRQRVRRDGSNPGQRPHRPTVPSRAGNCRLSNTSPSRWRGQICPLPTTRIRRHGEPCPYAGYASRRSHKMAGAAERVYRP